MGRNMGLLGDFPGFYRLELDARLFSDVGDQDQEVEDVLLLLT